MKSSNEPFEPVIPLWNPNTFDVIKRPDDAIGPTPVRFSLAQVKSWLSAPVAPVLPCLASEIDIVFAKLTLSDVAVITIEPVNGVVEFVKVTVSPTNVVVICAGAVLLIV